MVLVPLVYLRQVEPTEVGPLLRVVTADLSTPNLPAAGQPASLAGEREARPGPVSEAAAAPLAPTTTTTAAPAPTTTAAAAAPASTLPAAPPTVATTTTHTHAPTTTTSPPTTAPPPTVPRTTTTTLGLGALGLDGREVPKSSYHHRAQGVASWFGAPEATCAHVEIPKGTVVKVTRVSTGASTTCVINDWGPADRSRIIDLSDDTFARLAPLSVGLIEVIIEW